MGRRDAETETLIPTTGAVFDDAQVAHSLRGEGFDASEDGTGRGTPLVPVHTAPTLRAGGNATGGTRPYGTDVDTCDSLIPVTFDTTQITSAANYSNPKPGDACHPLAAGAHPPAIAFPAEMSGTQCASSENLCPSLSVKHTTAVAYAIQERAVSENLENGPQGKGFQEGVAYTLEARNKVQSVASTIETMYGVSHADASQADPYQALRALREAVGEEAYTEWCAGILAAFRTPEVLRSKVHGRSVRWARHDWHKLGDDALSCSEDGCGGAVLTLWEAGRNGRSPRGWKPSEQLARELVAHLSELPHQRASAQRFLLGLWRSSEGLGVLREALSALQEAWRPAQGENQPARLTSAVRRLTPEECEKLQGFLPGYTLIPWRKKPAEQCPDGPRYKALGNSMAVPVMAFIGQRIQQVENLISAQEAA